MDDGAQGRPQGGARQGGARRNGWYGEIGGAFGDLPGIVNRNSRKGVMSTIVSAEQSMGRRPAEGAAFSIILALSFSHFLNDMMQSLLPALYPLLKGAYGLSFAQIGLITLTSQLISSLLQPAIGSFADHRPQPY